MARRKAQKRHQQWPPANMNTFYSNNGGPYSMPGGIPDMIAPLPPFAQFPGVAPPYMGSTLPQMPSQAFFQPTPPVPQEPVGPRTAREVFGALATWTDLPDPSTVEAVFLVDLMSLLHTPGPNVDLMDSKTAKLIESGLERASWYDRVDVLEQVISEAKWNEALVNVVSQAKKVPNSVIVVQTSRIIEHTPLIQAAFQAKGLQAHMFAHTDYCQPQKLRKHQLIQRLWHYYPESSLVYYQSPSSHRDTKELNEVFQRLATVDRPLPMLVEVHNTRTTINPLAERKIIEQILVDVPTLEAHITPDRWVWRIQNYDAIINALGETGNANAIIDYLGRSMDYDSDVMPVVGDRGKSRTLRATKLVIAGSKISLVFENEHTLPVASLKQRAVDTIWPVDFSVAMVLDMFRSIVIKRVGDKPIQVQEPAPNLELMKDTPMESADLAPTEPIETKSSSEGSGSDDDSSSTSSSGDSSESESEMSEYQPDSGDDA